MRDRIKKCCNFTMYRKCNLTDLLYMIVCSKLEASNCSVQSTFVYTDMPLNSGIPYQYYCLLEHNVVLFG